MTSFNNDFKFDLEVGKTSEKLAAYLITGAKIEVKNDLRAHKTGNVFVEYMCRGKDSGILTSEADWYVFIYGKTNNRITFIPTSDLKKICKPLLGTNRDVVGGDDYTSRGILLPLESLSTKNI